MTCFRFHHLTLAATALAMIVSPASAEVNACRSGITAMAKAANPANYDPPRHYNAEALAKTRAIAAWHDRVEAKCPHDSSLWFRAKDKRVICEGYAVGTGCEAFAIPARRMGF